MQNRYYHLKESINPSIVGMKDGSVQAEIIESKITDKKQFEAYLKIFHSGKLTDVVKKPINQELTIDFVKLKSKAILTDFLIFSPINAVSLFLVSEKALSIIESLNIGKINNIKFFVYDNSNVKHTYRLLSIPIYDEQAVIFSKSTFFSGNKLIGYKSFTYDNYQDYITKSNNEPRIVRAEKLALKESMISADLDYFDINLSSHAFVSEKFKNAVLDNNLTGVDIVEAKDPSVYFIRNEVKDSKD